MVVSKEIRLTHREKTGAVQFKEFDLDMMVDHPAIVMVAKRGSGKSWVVRAILHYFAKKIPVGAIIAPTDKMSEFYASFFPSSFIHYQFDSQTIDDILNRQSDVIENNKNRKREGRRCVNTKAFIVMDDCLSSKGEWAKDKTIYELLFNGRHYHIMYILTMQFPLGITPELRGNFDYVFLLADDNIGNQKRLYDHYAGSFPCFEAFRQVFVQLTDDHGSMVLIKRDSKQELTEKTFYYKAPDLSSFNTRVGCKQFNDFHKSNFNEKWAKQKRISVDEKMSRKQLRHNKVIVEKIKNTPFKKKNQY